MELTLHSSQRVDLDKNNIAQHHIKTKFQTLPQSFPQEQNPQLVNKKESTLSENQSQTSSFKLKFNTSYQDLRCFISSPPCQKYRSVSTHLSKQSKSQAYLSQFKLSLEKINDQQQNQVIKSQTQRHTIDQLQTHNQSQQQSDLSQILSNEIIHQIEKKGIRYNWSNIGEIKSEYLQTDAKQDEIQLEDLFNTFSDKKNTRYSVKENSSRTYQSMLTENSIIENNQEEQLGQDKGKQTHGSNNQHMMNLNFDSYAQQGYDYNYEKNYSFASTIEPYSNLYYPMQMYALNQELSGLMNQGMGGLKSMPSSMFHSNEFIITLEGLGKDPRTTIMIKNIPNKYTIQFLSQEIDQQFGNYYDFLYLPCDTKSGANQGYGFINFVDLDAITRFYQRFHGKKWRRFRSQKICNLTYARLQGINSLIQHFQNSKVLNHKQKKYQPIIKKLNQQIHALIKQQQIAHQYGQKAQQNYKK